jgi:hypothetical protein
MQSLAVELVAYAKFSPFSPTLESRGATVSVRAFGVDDYGTLGEGAREIVATVIP